ncbi:MAG: hypothetical protein FWF88_10000 [Peptococcaceae bacterium]|nr:hypothetical protein [Peptococcaceae bacterium]
MKKLGICLAALALALSMTACGNTSGGSNKFTPQGETLTSQAGHFSVMVPSAEYDVWNGINWEINPKYSDNSIEIAVRERGTSSFYVRPGYWKQGASYKTVEDLEAKLRNGTYIKEGPYPYDKGEIVTIADVQLWDLTIDNTPKNHQYVLIKGDKVFGIQTYLGDDEYREVYDNVLKQVVLTVD